MRISFGVHQGAEIKDIPSEYLGWVLSEVDISCELEKEIRATLAERGLDPEQIFTLSIGKFRGFNLVEIPLNYLSWALDNLRLKAGVEKRIRQILTKANYPPHGHLARRDRRFKARHDVTATHNGASSDTGSDSPEQRGY